MKKISSRILGSIILCLIAYGLHAGPILIDIEPIGPRIQTIPQNQITELRYKITNKTNVGKTLSMKSIPGVVQNTKGKGLCGPVFTLKGKHKSCILSLLLNKDGEFREGLVALRLCEQSSPICYQSKQGLEVSVLKGPALEKALLSGVVEGHEASIKPPCTHYQPNLACATLTLVRNGPSGVINIQNNSSNITAFNIQSNFTGTALEGKVTETGNTCSTLPPGGTCTLTFTPGSVAVAQTNFPIQGTNTSVLQGSILINPLSPSIGGVNPNIGSSGGGTPVTVTGTELTFTTGLTFGGLSATSINVVDDNTVTAVTPAHPAGAVNVVISNTVGSATLINGYTYQDPPTLTQVISTYTNVSSGSVNGGTAVTLTGTSLLNTTSVTFDGIAATNVVVVNNTTVTADTPAHAAGFVNVAITTPAGTDTLINGYQYVVINIGDSLGGGIVACLGGGNLNIIADPADTLAKDWGDTLVTGAVSLTDGALNTTQIVNIAPTVDSLAVFCNGSSTGGYTDWFAPARTQLECLYTNQATIGGFNNTVRYWSSTEFSQFQAWAVFFADGTTVPLQLKTSLFNGRCTRFFTP